MLNFKMRLYPTAEQERRLEETCEINRIVYNYFIYSKFRSRNDMNYALTELKEQQPILRKYHSKMLQMISTKAAVALSALDELKKRGHPICGVVLNRDYNAASNVLQDGLKSLDLPMQQGEVTPAETLSGVVEAGTSPLALTVGS